MEVVSLRLARMVDSFSFSLEDKEIVDAAKKLASGDGKPFSELVMSLLKQEVHSRKPIEAKQQTQLEPFIENPEFKPMPSLLDPFKKWKAHIEDSDLGHIEKCERATQALTILCRETWKKKSQEALHQKISNDAAAFRGERR